MENRIFLEKVRSKQSSNTSPGLNIELKGGSKLLPLNDVSNVISQLEQYTEEREKCNTIRLTCQVNTICSNVLFNRVSEIVKYEGSNHVAFVNYGEGGDDAFGNNQIIYKPTTMDFWSGGTMMFQSIDNSLASAGAETPLDTIEKTEISANGSISQSRLHPTNAIRDMQLSRDDDNGDHFVYHCGLDILNNHLIRSKTFKCVCKMPDKDSDGWNPTGKIKEGVWKWEWYNGDKEYTAFNTIADIMREANGNKVVEKVYFPVSSGIEGGVKFVGLHTYLYDDLLTFNESIKQRLIEKHNGWLGFLNKSKIKSYVKFNEDDPQDMKMERPIMYMSGGDYVDMYPGRDLYSFVPKFNEYRNRMERNWNYCLTYPSSSTTEGFDDIIEVSNDSMKTIYFDENTRADSGAMQLVMYSKARHGLKPGDRVNIYKNYTNPSGETINEKVIDNAEVDEIVDPFIFTTFTQGSQISKEWVQLESEDLISGFTVNGIDYSIDLNTRKFFYDDRFNKYYIVNDKYVNVDTTAQNITYKKVVNEIECDYYVRIFSRLPNFRFASGDTTNEFNIYKKNKGGNSLLEECQKPDKDFESQLSRLAFSKNIYSDEVGEIVFMDDINLANIHDNLGRPLTEIYITIVKNNAGYKEWYGFDDTEININDSGVTFSHCFGKITCGFEMSDESIYDNMAYNIKKINNLNGNLSGYQTGEMNGRNPFDTEIIFDEDINYYGDLCCYDNYNAIEKSIQPILHRFNTAQRECKGAINGSYFSSIVYDEIARDDYDTGDDFLVSQKALNGCNEKPEGYYYEPHYKIQVKSLGKLNTIMPQFLDIQSLVNDGEYTHITTQQYHFLTQGDKSIIYDMSTDKYYYLTTVPGAGDSSRVFTCKIVNEKGNPTSEIDGDNIGNYRLFKIDNLGVPSYAHLLKDGTCRYIWRNVINNGSFGGDKNLEEYPFTNGAFYINRRIDLYVRRQDPYDKYGLYEEDDIDVIGVSVQIEDVNNYVSEEDIKC